MKVKLTVSLDPFEYDLIRSMSRHDDRSMSYILGRCAERVAYQKFIEREGLPEDELERIERKHGLKKAEDLPIAAG